MTVALLLCAAIVLESLHSIVDVRFSYLALILAVLIAALILAGVFT